MELTEFLPERSKTMATTTTRRPAKGKADQADQDQAQQQPQPAAEPQPQPEITEPEPGITVEPVPVTYYRPTVSLPAGYLGVPEARTVTCEHKYLHENEKLAAACGRKMAKAGAFVK